ncbi:hypothetical protein ACFL6C_05845 [Myxococcota bacterium]
MRMVWPEPGRWLSLVLLGGLLATAVDPAAAASERKKAKAKAAAKEQDSPKRPPREVAQSRPGSYLKRDKPLGDLADLRGEFERRRDFEVVRHYSRVAQLDAIEQVARKENDLALLERIDVVRRKELRRYLAVMQRLRDSARLKALQGNP